MTERSLSEEQKEALYEELEAFIENAEQISRLNASQKRIRSAITDILFDSENPQPEEVDFFYNGQQFKINLPESMKITDPEGLVDLVVNEMLTEDEEKALRLKPDLTLARLRKLPEDSQLHDFVVYTSGTLSIKEEKS